MQKSSEIGDATARIDYSRLEVKFGTVSTDKRKRAGQLQPQRPREVELLSSKRAMQVNVFIKSLPVAPTALVAALSLLEANEVTDEQLRGLVAILPDANEARTLREWSRKEAERIGDDLTSDSAPIPSEADQFLLAVLGVDHYKKRAEFLLLEREFGPSTRRIKSQLEKYEVVTSALEASPGLPVVLRVLLEIGNFFNTGTYGGNAYGISLGSLINLADTKSADGDMTLLDYVAEYIDRELASTTTEIAKLMGVFGPHESSFVDLGAVAADLAALDARAHTLFVEGTSSAIVTGGLKRQFLDEAIAVTSALTNKVHDLRAAGTRLCEMYVEDSATEVLMHIQQLLGVLTAALDRCRHRNDTSTAAESQTGTGDTESCGDGNGKVVNRQTANSRSTRQRPRNLGKRQGSWDLDESTGMLTHLERESTGTAINGVGSNSPRRSIRRTRAVRIAQDTQSASTEC